MKNYDLAQQFHLHDPHISVPQVNGKENLPTPSKDTPKEQERKGIQHPAI